MSFDPRPYWDDVRPCPLCGLWSPITNNVIERSGLTVAWSTCRPCNFEYQNPTMTHEGWMAFYSGPYREIAKSFHPGLECYEQAHALNIKRYSNRLAEWLSRRKVSATSILDAGGSTGEVGETIRQRLAPTAQLSILDPCGSELKASCETSTIQATIEGWDAATKAQAFDLVLCCQTADHLIDPLLALRNLHTAASPIARLVLDILDVRRSSVYKIDHPCRWSVQALYLALTRTGWTGTHHEILDQRHQMVLARPL